MTISYAFAWILRQRSETSTHVVSTSVLPQARNIFQLQLLEEIIHGDIKPENVLIVKNEIGAYTARVIDFGYSTVYTGRGRIEIPRTEGWEAPEWAQRGGFSFSEAQKVDVFSFGLVCLWLLLYDSSNPLNICKLRRETRNMAVFACDRVGFQSDIDDLKKEKLMMLFMSTLTSDPEERSSDLDPILKYLTTRRYDLKQ